MSRFTVDWSVDALEDWRQLALADAEAVALAVRGFAETGNEGRPVYSLGGAEYVLFVGDFAVLMFVEGDLVYIDRVRHA